MLFLAVGDLDVGWILQMNPFLDEMIVLHYNMYVFWNNKNIAFIV